MSGRRFWLWHAALPLALFLPLALAFERTHLDWWVVDRFYDPASGHWLGGGTWWAKGLIHEAGRRFISLIGVAAVLLWLGSFRRPQWRRWRAAAGYVALSILVSTTLVALLKHYSNVDCPDDLLRYGGDSPYVHVFADKPDAAPRGACFPGGHSSGAFSLLALYFVFRGRSLRHALLSLAAVMALGGLFAVGQWSRGEHFPSHDAWSAFLCWWVALGLYVTAFRGRDVIYAMRDGLTSSRA